MPTNPEFDRRRRAFLAGCSAAGIGSALLPGILWAQSDGGRRELTADAIAEAARLAGLEFSPADCETLRAGLQANLALFDETRALRIDQSVPPPLYFNPAVPGQTFSSESRPFRMSEPDTVERPDNLEDAAFWPVTSLAELVRTRRVSSVDLTRMYLDRLHRYDPLLKCVITYTSELALEQAARADEEIAAGRYRGPLHGIPWGAKDLLAKKGFRTTWGFEAYRDQVIDEDATVVQRLEAAGAVLVAKLSTGEIARGDVWFGGQTRNPWKPDEGSGGSSAGPAAATAAGLVGFSIGTETLGSILGPARRCGLTGLRPTFGRISRHGVMPVCWSLDKVGPLCRTVEDAALVFDAIRGPDGRDLAVVDQPFNWDGTATVDGLRVGYLASAFERESSAELDNEREVLAAVRRLGLDPEPFELPADAGMDALQMLLVDEAAAFDELVLDGGIEYFNQAVDDPEDVLMRIARLYPAVEYLQVNRRRMRLMQAMAEAFGDFDVVIAPFDGSPVQSAMNLTGHPGLTVPSGFDAGGRPTGILFVGRLYAEAEAMLLARAYQDATGHHRRHPTL